MISSTCQSQEKEKEGLGKEAIYTEWRSLSIPLHIYTEDIKF